eukprot:PhM_4_TR749/c0_g3_i1/m.43279
MFRFRQKLFRIRRFCCQCQRISIRGVDLQQQKRMLFETSVSSNVGSSLFASNNIQTDDVFSPSEKLLSDVDKLIEVQRQAVDEINVDDAVDGGGDEIIDDCHRCERSHHRR